jgi:predicted Zn-ribbon and HTH transcriptional regulator
MMIMKMRCPYCGYEWEPRLRDRNPKSCPRCKRYLPWKKTVKTETAQ